MATRATLPLRRPKVVAKMPRMKPISHKIARFAFTALTLAAILSASGTAMAKAPLPAVSKVDVPRYMGTWYVIASIPTFLEKNAFNAVESYALNADGSIAVKFTFHKGAFDGPVKTLKPRGFVKNASGALWGMRMIWPLKSEYAIAYLNDDYTQVVVARSARDHVWMMSRQPQISDSEYQTLQAKIADLGYDTAKLQRVPQRWP